MKSFEWKMIKKIIKKWVFNLKLNFPFQSLKSNFLYFIFSEYIEIRGIKMCVRVEYSTSWVVKFMNEKQEIRHATRWLWKFVLMMIKLMIVAKWWEFSLREKHMRIINWKFRGYLRWEKTPPKSITWNFSTQKQSKKQKILFAKNDQSERNLRKTEEIVELFFFVFYISSSHPFHYSLVCVRWLTTQTRVCWRTKWKKTSEKNHFLFLFFNSITKFDY